LSSDESNRFGVIQPEAARDPLLGQKTGAVQEELFNFAWREVHRLTLPRPRIVSQKRGGKSKATTDFSAHKFRTLAGDAQKRAASDLTGAHEQGASPRDGERADFDQQSLGKHRERRTEDQQ